MTDTPPDSLTRRKFIRSVAAGVTLVTIPGTSFAEERIDGAAHDRDHDTPIPAGTLHGTAGPLDDVSGAYPSRLFWAPEEWFSNPFVGAAATVGLSTMDDGTVGRIYFNADNFPVTNFTLYHERGHNLGFRHADGGLMDYDAPDAGSKGLHETTRTIADHSAGAHVLHWGDDDALDTALALWRDGHLPPHDIRYAIEQWRRDATHSDLYSDGHFARLLDNADATNQGHASSDNVYTGGFYRDINRTYDGTAGWR